MGMFQSQTENTAMSKNEDPFHEVDIFAVCLGVLIIVVSILICSCSVTFRPDGSRTYSVDAETLSRALRAVPVVADK